VYLEFQRFGIGQEKLYKLQLRKHLDKRKLDDTPELRRFIESNSDEEISDELVSVQLKNFMDIRKLARDAAWRMSMFSITNRTVVGCWCLISRLRN
jgi:hypothetical protein